MNLLISILFFEYDLLIILYSNVEFHLKLLKCICFMKVNSKYNFVPLSNTNFGKK